MKYVLAVCGLIFTIACIVAGVRYAQAYDQSFCSTYAGTHSRLTQAGEVLVMTVRGEEDPAMKGYFANPETGEWTLVKDNGDGTLCTIQNGADFELYQDAVKLLRGGDPA